MGLLSDSLGEGLENPHGVDHVGRKVRRSSGEKETHVVDKCIHLSSKIRLVRWNTKLQAGPTIDYSTHLQRGLAVHLSRNHQTHKAFKGPLVIRRETVLTVSTRKNDLRDIREVHFMAVTCTVSFRTRVAVGCYDVEEHETKIQ